MVRILTQSTGPLHTIAFTIRDPSPENFRAWRVGMRNRVDYLRRTFPVWRDFGFYGWLQSDGTVRGIVTLDMLGRGEVEKGLERWGMTLGPEVGHEGLRVAIWNVVKPTAIYSAGPAQGRYWPVRCSIWPCLSKQVSSSPWVDSPTPERSDPMPWLM